MQGKQRELEKCNRDEQVKGEMNPKPIINLSEAIYRENN
jgi:hypothetical protein